MPTTNMMTQNDIVWPISREILNRLRVEGTEYLGRITDSLIKEGIRVSSVIVEGGIAEKILEYSAANRIDLITISTHGRSGIGRWVFGSVTEKLLQYGDTPVLVVRPGVGENPDAK
jgi:nucleotide-binding universal stress UspA family protein